MSRKIVIIGAGGHSKVVADSIEKSGDNIVGFLDDGVKKRELVIKDYTVIGKIADCERLQATNREIGFVIAIGNNHLRKEIFEKYPLNYCTVIHPSACIGMEVEIGEGTVVMPNGCINSNVRIGRNCIINTGSIVEHDNEIGDYVHISPNATLCGNVRVKELSHVGAGAIVKNNIEIIENCVIGAGSVVVKDIEEIGTYVGVPARKIK